MSSLLQFSGTITREGVHLMFYRVGPDIPPAYEGDFTHTSTEAVEQYTCPECGRLHPVLYTAIRKPAGMFGPWVLFRYNGSEHAPDLSCPIRVPTLPRGATRMDTPSATRYWHS